MKKRNLFKKLFIFICIPVLCAVTFSIGFNKKVKTEQGNSAYFVESSKYIEGLMAQNSVLESSYNLNSYYPIFTENQTDSNLCWIYSSLKVLETSLMKQRNEYHNFSEIGTALLNFINYTAKDSSIDDDLKKIDRASHFSQFNLVAQNYGLIYENVLSNDVYFDVNENNISLYNDALATADKSIMSDINAINISDDLLYIQSNRNDKINILKRYISTYGGVFAGLEKGIISNVDSVYYQTNNQSNSAHDGAVSSEHAICIVGWNDEKDCGTEGTGAFYVLNSWGVASNSYNYFYVPYSYGYIYEDAYGYICLDENTESYSQVLTTAGGDDGFTARFMNSYSVNPKNLFKYGEEIEMVYNISDSLNFDSIFLYIYQGHSNVTSDFELNFDDATRNVTITLTDTSSSGEGYYIEFYNDKTFMGREDFYIFTGTEVSYIEFKDNSPDQVIDSTLFNNNFASGNFSQTYYLYDSAVYDYYLDFYLPALNDSKDITYNNVSLTIGTIYINSTDSEGTINRRVATSSDYTTVKLDPNQITIKNRLRVRIKELIRKNIGKMVEFSVDVKSLITGKTSTYYFNIFVGDYSNAETSEANKIQYSLDGGVNNKNNINRYPDYLNEDSMTAINLLAPTKTNSTFIGWYLDQNHTIEVSRIDENIASLLGEKYKGDIIIYARWEEQDLNFFDATLEISSIVDYDGNNKNIANKTIIYGDSVNFLFTFIPELENLKNYKYFADYTYYFNGTFVDSKELNEEGESIEISNRFLSNGKPYLVVGDYEIKVNVFMVVSHQFSINKDYTLKYSVEQKEITATFDENKLSFVYDAKEHMPTLVSLNGVYKEDKNIKYELDNGYQKDYGQYKYNLISVDNNNYKIAQNQGCTMNISKANISIEWLQTTTTYNGKKQEPSYVITGIIGDDIVLAYYGLRENLMIEPELINAGTYELTVRRISNDNYQLTGDASCDFVIKKAKLKLIFNDVNARFTLSPNNRPKITWKIEGNLYDDESELNIIYESEGIRTTESGEFPITGSYSNENYDMEIINGTYKILGAYYIFYTLPDGTEYKELVEEGQTPKGITSDIYPVSIFHKIKYSEELVGNGSTDLYVKVTVENYTWIAVIVGAVLFFFILYRLSTRKARRNRMR